MAADRTYLLAAPATVINPQEYCLADLNSDIQQYNLNDLSVKLAEKCNVNTSKREIQCLYYLMKGKSARETGTLLNLSQRTVEYYLNCLKEKMHCSRKSELIEVVYKLFSD